MSTFYLFSEFVFLEISKKRAVVTAVLSLISNDIREMRVSPNDKETLAIIRKREQEILENFFFARALRSHLTGELHTWFARQAAEREKTGVNVRVL